MIFNLLVLPLAAGYYLLTRSFYFKFRQQRLDRQRLLFETVIAGVFILIGGFAVKTLVYDTLVNEEIRNAIHGFNPVNTSPYSGTVLVSFVFTILLTELCNLKADKKKQIQEAIKKIGNEFELMASMSFREKYLVLITLKNDKFYVGWVKELPIPSQSNYLRIIPALSGVRNEHKRLEFTTHYLSAYAKYIEEKQIKDIEGMKTDIVLDIEEIISISFYDQDLYETLN